MARVEKWSWVKTIVVWRQKDASVTMMDCRRSFFMAVSRWEVSANNDFLSLGFSSILRGYWKPIDASKYSSRISDTLEIAVAHHSNQYDHPNDNNTQRSDFGVAVILQNWYLAEDFVKLHLCCKWVNLPMSSSRLRFELNFVLEESDRVENAQWAFTLCGVGRALVGSRNHLTQHPLNNCNHNDNVLCVCVFFLHSGINHSIVFHY